MSNNEDDLKIGPNMVQIHIGKIVAEVVHFLDARDSKNWDAMQNIYAN